MRTQAVQPLCKLSFMATAQLSSVDQGLNSAARSACHPSLSLVVRLCRKLGCPEGRSAATWVDYSLFGHQIVCHHVKGYSAAASRNAGAWCLCVPASLVTLRFAASRQGVLYTAWWGAREGGPFDKLQQSISHSAFRPLSSCSACLLQLVQERI